MKKTKRKLAERQREKYWRLKDMGICTACGKREADDGRCFCFVCAEKRYSANARRRERLTSDGLCVACGSRQREEKVSQMTGEKRLLLLCSVCNAKNRKLADKNRGL